MLDFLFVYGTLRRETKREEHHLLARHATFLGDATYQGRLYRIDSYPGIVPSDDPNQQVKGELYSFHEPDKILPTLDQYEECGPGFSEPTEYVRVKQDVVLSTGQRQMAWVYIYNWPTEELPLIASGDFWRSCDGKVNFR